MATTSSASLPTPANGRDGLTRFSAEFRAFWFGKKEELAVR